ncbi:GIY-YIG nuclease family protein [Pediococcus acidilactici]|uniref:GIY-YIG nuclease family protein n=1 Tax=Pediococcus acidilactici TaxID=1254 RepID=UPI0025A65250|nr:GIY-YIG nuclease family protein [Pediococcus acidilactici]MDM5042665.1 GIY-YIG nuclease family protein [Pediococcus acidilactici]
MNNQTIHSLEDVFNDPEADELLVAKPKKKTVSTDPDVENFKEIQAWVKQHNGKEPEKTWDMSRMTERRMANRLKGYRSHEDMIELLKPYDELGLLNQESQKLTLEDTVKSEQQDFNSLDDILGDDSILFGDSNQNTVNSKLFDTKKLHEIRREQENQPEKVSQRHQMADFEKFEPLFKKIQAELASGKRQLRPFKNYEILLHHFYVLKGQLLYIEAIGAKKSIDNKSKRKTDARLHVIYENGTENTPLLNGLAASMYGRNGKIVTEPDDNFELSSGEVTGYIYVLKSESDNPEVRRVQEEHSLYKVGYTTGTVEKRIANAENEPTYLYGPVKICEEFQVSNLNSEALETAIHHALANYRLDVDIKAPNGRLIHPREWFVTDLSTINDVVNGIVAKLQMNQG